jgi:cell division protease FtsH
MKTAVYLFFTLFLNFSECFKKTLRLNNRIFLLKTQKNNKSEFNISDIRKKYPKYFSDLKKNKGSPFFLDNTEFEDNYDFDDDENEFDENNLDEYSKLILGVSNNTTKKWGKKSQNNNALPPHRMAGIHIIFQKQQQQKEENKNYTRRERPESAKNKRSENFQVITQFPVLFKDIGGYENIKSELYQCVDILRNFSKYLQYNVRIPKGLIFEGPPGNGKTLLAKAFAGECQIGFIAVSGSEFQDKYVGVGSSRVRELFELAHKNKPCIIFIDEIDAIGRSRSKENDGEGASAERDNTLNELLIALDGFKNNTGVFIIGATNRADLLDPALLRPGRIDKRIFIGLPDEKTRKSIINIHIYGKPHDKSVITDNIIELTAGLSGAQIENLLNEAMLNALRFNRNQFSSNDIDIVLNKMMVGWQPNEHEFTKQLIYQICVHEMGHAIVGLMSLNHSKMKKVVINLSSPKSPGYTIFDNSKSTIYTREGLFEHLAILLSGRIAEELFFGIGSVTNGALNDFEEALKLAHKMVVYYGMGKQMIYPSFSDKYKEMIDADIIELIHSASDYAYSILIEHKHIIKHGADILEKENLLKNEDLQKLL